MSARSFLLIRDVDETRISGTGIVAEGIVFSNGKVVLGWLGKLGVPSLGVFDSIEQVEQVHGHGGATRVVWQGEGASVPRAAVVAKPPAAPKPEPKPESSRTPAPEEWTVVG